MGGRHMFSDLGTAALHCIEDNYMVTGSKQFQVSVSSLYG